MNKHSDWMLDAEELFAALIKARGWSTPSSLASTLEHWAEFVDSVESGYEDMTIYDYVNDLTTREIIELVIQSAPSAIKARIFAFVAPLDERFRGATRRSASGGLPATGWWGDRVPSEPKEPLRTDLLEAGH